MGCAPRANLVSKEYTGNRVFEFDYTRPYLFIIMIDQNGSIQLGDDGGKIPIPAGKFYEPLVCPSSKLTVETTGTYVVVTSASTHNASA